MAAPPVITAQHGARAPGIKGVEWMSIPARLPGCPPGLEYLTTLDQIFVQQITDSSEVLPGSMVKNCYALKNSLGQQVFFAREVYQSNPEKKPILKISTKSPKEEAHGLLFEGFTEVIRVNREYGCGFAGCCCCANCCAFEMTIEAPPGTPVGYIRQTETCWKTFYQLIDAKHTPIFEIQGPCCPIQAACCTDDVRFEIISCETKERIGEVSKQWAGCCEVLDNNFSVQFPQDLDVKMKAALIGGSFLVSAMTSRPTDTM